MTPERYRQIERLYHEALELPAGRERAAFVETACAGDEALRREVESLLGHGEGNSFLETPPDAVAAEMVTAQRVRTVAGRKLRQYQIRSLLGVGGMGEIYLADDLLLARQVALKLLPAQFTRDDDRMRRFVREAKAAAALSHPNVAHIYEIGEVEGVSFIAMEFVQGRTLDLRIKEGPLDAAEIVSIASQVADALEEAHAKGIIHRDIKPSNIMITPRGQAKVLDFGVAKMTGLGREATVGDASGPPKTTPGALVGTVEYMSPEQALGQEVDGRTDIYSLGTVLYEMAAGRRPFTGRSNEEILEQILHRAPEPLAKLNAQVSPSLAQVIHQCIEKKRERRYQSARELLADLVSLRKELDSGAEVKLAGIRPGSTWRPATRRSVAAGATVLAAALLGYLLFFRNLPARGRREVAPSAAATVGLGENSPSRVRLAVLPFENIAADPDRDYLADALTEETITALGQIDPEHLSVIGRTSVMTYKRTAKTLAEIGRELDAAYLVESSIRSEVNRVRVTSKLIRAANQVQIWSASYDSEPSSMLAFQRELSTAIAEQIRQRLSPERLSALARRQTRNPEAYDLYLRGRHVWNQLTPRTTQRAIEYFSQATELDRNYALAWSGLADAYAASPINGDAPPLSVGPRARDAAAQAVRAEPDLAEVQSSLGVVKFWFDWDWIGAETAFRKAITLDPSYAFAHRNLGITLSHMGQREEAGSEMQRARALDPLYAVQHALSAQVAFVARDYPAAVQFARQAIAIDPGFWIGYFQLAQAYQQTGEIDLAFEALNSAGRLSGGNSKVLSLRGYILAKQSRIKEAREMLSTLQEISRDHYVPPYAMALVEAGLGEPNAALDWLERAANARDVHLVLLPADPKWDPFRQKVRFRALLKRCGLSSFGPG
jgi:serine/threonine-protein kinase